MKPKIKVGPKKCPKCNSSKVSESIRNDENGKKYYVYSCQKCGFKNERVV